ncbi:hypothetical protein JTB14_005759 [Gonioctena quinquepunctata]|nr:hypothetical protein JTB14_005759 [Gonioctena quinquepunctata]
MMGGKLLRMFLIVYQILKLNKNGPAGTTLIRYSNHQKQGASRMNRGNEKESAAAKITRIDEKSQLGPSGMDQQNQPGPSRMKKRAENTF